MFRRTVDVFSAILLQALVVLCFGAIALATVSCEGGDPGPPARGRPDPFVRLTDSRGGTSCSGGVIRADETGVWVSTAAHCTGRAGSRAWATFYWRGYESPVIEGRVFGEHPRWDCAVLWFPPDSFPVPPAVTPPANPRDVRVGRIVYSVGSNAGGTHVPAVQKMRITRITSGGYEFLLNDDAWGGHSGGPIIDAETNRLLGNLWGGGGGESIITSVSALWEVLTQRHRPQAFFCVSDSRSSMVNPSAVMFHVYGSRDVLEPVYVELVQHDCLKNLRWTYHGDALGRFEINWVVRGKRWKVTEWEDAHTFLARVKQTGVAVSECTGGQGWPPGEIGGGRRPGQNPWQNPWDGAQPPADPRVDELQQTIEELQEKLSESRQDEPAETRETAEGIESLPEMTRRAVEQLQRQREAISESGEYLRQIAGTNESRECPVVGNRQTWFPLVALAVVVVLLVYVARKKSWN